MVIKKIAARSTVVVSCFPHLSIIALPPFVVAFIVLDGYYSSFKINTKINFIIAFRIYHHYHPSRSLAPISFPCIFLLLNLPPGFLIIHLFFAIALLAVNYSQPTCESHISQITYECHICLCIMYLHINRPCL
jgi:hypothetical protein